MLHIYNFILRDTVENRVREVLEEKLSVILKEMGVDKYSDVLDSEIAEVDFTDVYMDSISRPSAIDRKVASVERDMKKQMEYVKKYKEIIREDKDLTQLVGHTSDFDVDAALDLMMRYYRNWKGLPTGLTEHFDVTDPEVTVLMRGDVVQDRKANLLSVGIPNFPNEAGYFMLWELSISNDADDKRILPMFFNSSLAYRPVAGKRLMNVFLDANSKLTVRTGDSLSADEYKKLEELSMQAAYDTFLEMKEKHLQKNQENYNKYRYAWKLRTEAAEHIGIENIRKSRLAKLATEQGEIESAYKAGQQVYPDFKLTMLIKLEA